MVQDPHYKVKNTFVEFTLPEGEYEGRGRRTRSDATPSQSNNYSSSPLVVAKSPTGSPTLHPVDEAVPIDGVTFELLEEAAPVGSYQASMPSSSRYGELGEAAMVATNSNGLDRDEPAYVVPTTPSPFLHSAFPPSVVPPFGGFGGYGLPGGGLPDMGLPPAFGSDAEPGQGADANFVAQDVDGNFIQGMPFMPPEMFDPSFAAQYMQYGWDGSLVDGSSFGQDGQGLGEQMPGLDGQPGGKSDGFGDGTFGEGGYGEAGFGEGLGDGFSGEQAGDGRVEASASSPSEKKESRRKRNREKKAAAAAAAAADEVGSKDVSSAGVSGKMGDASGGGSEKPSKAGSGDAEPEKRELKGDITDTPSIYTTVMLRNIPNKYTREMLVKQLSLEFKGLFDFLYLPIDFKNKCNVGYGFINFRTTDACDEFVRQFHGVDVRKCLPGLNSKKIVEVTPARVQGLIENVRRLRNSPVMNQLQDHPEWMPLLFNEYGVEEPFPNPDQPLPPVKPRGRAREGKKEDGEMA